MKFYTLKYVHCWIYFDCVTNKEQKSNEKVAKTILDPLYPNFLTISKNQKVFNFIQFSQIFEP